VSVLSVAYVALPISTAFADIQPAVVQTDQSFSYKGYDVSASRIDTYYASGAHNVSFVISTAQFSSSYSRYGAIGRGTIYELRTDPIPYTQLLTLLSLNDPSNSTDQSNATASASSSSSSGLPQYQWNGITFVQAGTYEYQGASLWVKYDHPDNYEVYHLNPNGSPDVNDEYVIKGASGVEAFHASKSDVNGWISDGQLGGLATAIAGVVVAGSGGIGILLGVFLVIVGFAFSQFVQQIIQTELGDGWVYVQGVGHWNCWFLHSVGFSASFGSWQNWWFHFFISNFAGMYCVPL